MKNIILIDGYPVTVEPESIDWSINWFKPGFFTIRGRYKENAFNASVLKNTNVYNVNINGSSYEVETVPENYFAEQDKKNTDGSILKSPMTGIIKDIIVTTGEQVKSGQLLLRIESMKLVLSVNSSQMGKIKDIRVKPGQKISAGDFLMEFENEG